MEQGYSAMTRRERLERIAQAERDRRGGRIEVAIAALGEALEWPARAVLALARLPEFEASETRQILEDGLDIWLADMGLGSFEEPVENDSIQDQSSDLDRPIDNDELDRAFAEAEAQTDEMLSANHVAARVLMDEPVGLAELDGDEPTSVEEPDVMIAMDAAIAEDLVAVDRGQSRSEVLATLERWLQNLEGRGARRAR